MKSWADIGFEVEITGDGSPSLRLLESVDPLKFRGESMHHSGGACAETLLIYGEPARIVWQQIENPSFLIVGLGLGYIEMTLAREALLLGKKSSSLRKITSYESIPELASFFVDWLNDRHQNLKPEVKAVYDQVLSFVVAGTSISNQAVKDFLKPHLGEIEQISGALEIDSILESGFHCILYDAFSSKTTPHLWDDDFLKLFLQQSSAESTLFSTYACRVGLRRALKAADFEIYVREGFQGKRNSTLGSKGIHL